MIREDRWAKAYQGINDLLDAGESILVACGLENFLQDGGVDTRRAAIATWLGKAEPLLVEVLIDPLNAVPFEIARLQEAIEGLNPQPPSAAQLRRLFTDFTTDRLQLLNAMIGRQESATH